MPIKLIEIKKIRCLFRNGVRQLYVQSDHTNTYHRCVVNASNHWFRRYRHLYTEIQFTHIGTYDNDDVLIDEGKLEEKWGAAMGQSFWVGSEGDNNILLNFESDVELFLFQCEFPSIQIEPISHLQNTK